jgi:L-alanine-DL-glutamate epimerase-like enolase superfamily enzyme
MKIVELRTALANIPYKTWIVAPEIKTFGCVLVFVDTDEGITGESVLWAFGTRYVNVLNSMVLSMKPDLVGENPHYTERLWQKLWREIGFFGVEGISVFGLSAIDRACWDIVGKAVGKPLYKLLGACRDRVPAYACGLWLNETMEELVNEARGFVRQGYRAMKLRIGKSRMEEDFERAQAVREAIGPEVKLMVDANQRFSAGQAIRIGQKLEELDIAWFEEPVPAYDIAGSAQVAAALDMPIANGENIYTRYGFRRILEMKAADILMPDLIRVGGITEFLKVAHMAEAYEIPVTPHIFPEESMHLVGAIPNCTYLENMPWLSPLYREKIEVEDGSVVLPQRPGFGFTFDPDAIERYRLRE